MKTVMVTGGAGFFGGILKRAILESGDRCISVDVVPDHDEHPNLEKHQIDLRDQAALDKVFAGAKIDGVPGEGTAKAIRNFEVFYDYKVTGQASPQLLGLPLVQPPQRNELLGQSLVADRLSVLAAAGTQELDGFVQLFLGHQAAGHRQLL